MASENPQKTGHGDTHEVLVWDFPVRLFHWLLAAGVAAAWFAAEYRKEIGDFTMTIHKSIGLGMLTLILFRLVWGVVGSRTARFADFVKSPGAALKHARELLKRRPSFAVGHTALGGYSVVLMLAAVGVQPCLGLFADDDIAARGPLARFVSGSVSDVATSLHHLNFNVILALAGLHVAAILFYKYWKRESLTLPMITGAKSLPRGIEGKPMRSPILGLLLLAAIAALVYGANKALAPPPSPFQF